MVSCVTTISLAESNSKFYRGLSKAAWECVFTLGTLHSGLGILVRVCFGKGERYSYSSLVRVAVHFLAGSFGRAEQPHLGVGSRLALSTEKDGENKRKL